MLAECRGGGEGARSAGEIEREAVVGVTPDNLMVEIMEEASVLNLEIVELALGAQYHAGGDARGLQGLHDILGITFSGPFADEAVEIVFVGFSRFQGREAGVADDVGPVQDHAEAGPFFVGEDGDRAPGVVA